jgi:hypothetical protein
MDKRPFSQSGFGVLIVAAAPAPVGLQVLSDGSALKTNQYRIQNNGTVTIWYAHGDSDTDAQTKAAAPTGAGNTARRGVPLGAGAIEVITAPPNAWFSATAASGTANVYITPGEGL